MKFETDENSKQIAQIKINPSWERQRLNNESDQSSHSGLIQHGTCKSKVPSP